MRHWPTQDAKARFSELIEASEREGPQIITRGGVETAVVVTVAEWRRLNADRPPRDLKQLLLADEPRFDLEIPERATLRHRPPAAFDD